MVLVMLMASVLVSGCGGSSGDAASLGAPKPQPTPVGSATGVETKSVIGSSGGTITLNGGNVEFAVPEGALDSDTEISLQPILESAKKCLLVPIIMIACQAKATLT